MFEKNPDPDSVRNLVGPAAVDQVLRQAVPLCWMMLPPERKTVANVEAEIRRILDRVLQNLREDSAAFGIKPDA